MRRPGLRIQKPRQREQRGQEGDGGGTSEVRWLWDGLLLFLLGMRFCEVGAVRSVLLSIMVFLIILIRTLFICYHYNINTYTRQNTNKERDLA